MTNSVAGLKRPRRCFIAESVDDPQAALAAIVDQALAFINAEIADRDESLFALRDVAAPE